MPDMDLGIAGKVALVGGASKGIGRAIAAQLVAEGCRVAITSRSRERIDAAATAISARGFVWDSGDPAGASALVDEVEAALGSPVEILVTNTGGPPFGPDPLGFTPEQWQAAYTDLVAAPMALITRCMPAMRAAGWGRIVNVASTSVREPLPYLMLSNAHRAATLAAFKTLAREVAGDGVTLNTLLTGRIATERLADAQGSLEPAEAGARTQVPAGRLGTPEEMAAAAAFLCSVPAGYITGVGLLVDGGLAYSV
jgi:3-oxoacyl-[acyl-carrier protein] reductase